MMSSIDEFFDTNEVVYEISEVTNDVNGTLVYDTVAKEVKETNSNINKKEYSETNIKKVIDTGMKALPDMLRVLKDSDDPKMYMSASEFMRTLVDLNKEFSSEKNIGNEIVQTNQNTTNNNVIMMSSTELLKTLNG